MRTSEYGAGPDGTLVHYIVNRRERNPTLVFIHGAGSNHTVWDNIVTWFKYRSYIAVDLRNHGLSGFGKFNLSNITRDIANIIQRENIKEFIPVGMSLGALVAAELTHIFPKEAKKAILISPSSRTLINGSTLLTEAMRWIHAFVSIFPARKHLRMTKHDKLIPAIINPFWELQGIHTRDYARTIEVSIAHELRQPKVPTLIVTGENDVLMNKQALAKIKGQHIQIASHHLLLTRAPEHVAELIAAFAEDP